MLTLRIDAKVLNTIEKLPGNIREDVVSALSRLSEEAGIVDAENLTQFGLPDWYRLKVGDYRIIFRYPLPPIQPGGYTVLMVLWVGRHDRQINDNQLRGCLIDGAWHALKSVAPHK